MGALSLDSKKFLNIFFFLTGTPVIYTDESCKRQI